MRKPALRSVGALLAGACLALAAPANAQVKTGDTIGKAEVDKVKDLVSPGVAFFLKKGMTIKVVDPTPIPWPKAYKEATEKFSAQVKLASDGVSIDNYRFKELLGPVVAPFDLKGLGALSFRYRSAAHQDDTWLYLPTLRRVRRLSTTQRSDALFGQDTDPDSYWGYNGHIAWQEWKLLGEKEMLAVFHGANFPMKRCDGGADF